MTGSNAQVKSPRLAELVAGLERHGTGRPGEIARRLGSGWTKNKVVAVPAELFSNGVVGHNHQVGLWWVA